ncbi:MAG: ATP-binding protein, partial [Thermomicrobiales bacterium]
MDRLPPALPVPLSPLIGRERECADLVASLLDGRTRLLTVTGPGDVGKTRLALAVAQSLESIGADGARFVPLAGMLTAQDVLPAIARAVGVEETGDRPLFAEIVVRLGNSDALLVIDNAEHVADAAPELARLLAACPALRMLVTSRVAMRIQGEREFSLLPFALPGPDATAAALTGSDAVALFLESSREDRSRLVRSDADLVAIGGICRRLDGLPLAIELAAARSTVLSPRGMLARLERRLPLRTGGGRDLPERQRTLRATIRWSYDLLTPTQQRLFRQISVFSSATLEAIEGDQMGIADPIPGDASPIFDDLAALVDHSLLRRSEDPDREPRYFMLETIREFGHEMLAELDELASAKERHASFFAKFAESGASALTGPEQAHWLRRFERDQDNLRVALRWAIEERATRTAARIGSSLGRWWLLRGHLTEGRRWIGEVLALDPDAVTAERATTLTVMGALAEDQGDHTAAIAAHGESLAIAEALSDDYGIARATNNIGLVRLGQGDYAAATRQFEASLLAFRSLGNDAAGAVTMLNLATVADRAGDEETASRILEAALTVQRAAGDAQRIAWTLQTLGLVATGRGELDQADAAFVEAIALWEELGDAQSVARTLAHRGRLARLRGEKERAAELLAEG